MIILSDLSHLCELQNNYYSVRIEIEEEMGKAVL